MRILKSFGITATFFAVVFGGLWGLSMAPIAVVRLIILAALFAITWAIVHEEVRRR